MYLQTIFYRIKNSTNNLNKSKIIFIKLVLLSWFFAFCSQISIPLPFNLVPLSLQPLPLFIATLTLGWPAVTAYGIYLLQGACGAPFFAGFQGGLMRLLGPTGGYLMGFLFAMIFLTLLNIQSKKYNIVSMFFIFCSAYVIIFCCGLGQLSWFISTNQILKSGLYPFIIGDFCIKLPIALWITYSLSFE